MSDAEDEVARIRHAAWHVLERSGFEGFKMQVVLRRADLSARAFYRHFAGKDELLVSLLKEEMVLGRRRIERNMARASTPSEQVAAWIRSTIELADHPRLASRARLFSSQRALVDRFSADLVEATDQFLEPLRTALAEGKRSGELPWCNPEIDAQLIHALSGTVMGTALARRDPATTAELTEATIAMVLRSAGVAPG